MNALILGLAVIAAPQPPITAIVFSPDGEHVLAGSQAGVVVHQWPNLKRVRSIPTKLAHVHDLAFSPDGKRLAIVGGSPGELGEVEIFDWPKGTLIHRHGGHDDLVFSIAWAEDSSSYATAGLDHRLIMWRADTGKELRRFEGHSRGVTSAVFLPKEQGLLSAGLDQSLRLWDPKSGASRRTFNNHTQPVRAMAVRPNVEGLPMVASISEDRTVRLWQPTIGRLVRFVRLESAPLAVAWLPDGSQIAVASEDGHVRLIDPDTVKVVRDTPVTETWAYSVAVHPTDTTIIVGARWGKLLVVHNR